MAFTAYGFHVVVGGITGSTHSGRRAPWQWYEVNTGTETGHAPHHFNSGATEGHDQHQTKASGSALAVLSARHHLSWTSLVKKGRINGHAATASAPSGTVREPRQKSQSIGLTHVLLAVYYVLRTVCV